MNSDCGLLEKKIKNKMTISQLVPSIYKNMNFMENTKECYHYSTYVH